MAKSSWNAFVSKYPGAGYLVSTGTQPNLYKKPSGISQNNQKQWPNIPSLMNEAIGKNFGGEWAHSSQQIPRFTTKNGKRVKAAAATMHLFVFEQSSDALIAAKFLRAPSMVPVNSPNAGFVSLIRGQEVDMQEYLRIARILGY